MRLSNTLFFVIAVALSAASYVAGDCVIGCKNLHYVDGTTTYHNYLSAAGGACPCSDRDWCDPTLKVLPAGNPVAGNLYNETTTGGACTAKQGNTTFNISKCSCGTRCAATQYPQEAWGGNPSGGVMAALYLCKAGT